YELTDRYAALLEEMIRREPAYWLWTHNRWKRTKEEWERRQSEEKKEERK
ncbi:MAG: acetyltransferase, partial [Candidatus Phocaeicola faecipullorum]|nr:acetyltransferase [Candidatus Phocaeicola faecipullorum]